MTTSETSRRSYDEVCLCSPPMETSPVTVTFPAVSEYLRLARIATADAGSRAGLDFEEIDDVRIAVSELCSLVSVDADASVTLAFRVADGTLTVEGESRTGAARISPNELSATIISAVADQHSLSTTDGVTRFVVTKRTRSAR
jgi:serine/threonine-protein kinase RsbW